MKDISRKRLDVIQRTVIGERTKILPEYIDNSFLENILGDVFCVALSYLICPRLPRFLVASFISAP
jgi:hypothetical protein